MLYIITILIILLDQVTKYYAVQFLKSKPPYVIIDNFLQLNYVENFGAAFGILKDKKIFFVVITVTVVIGILVYLKANNKLTMPTKLGLTMIASGAIGNLIDRIRLGYVVDMIDVKFGSLYDYPVFNVADSAIVVGTIVIAYLVLFNKYEKN